MATNFGPIFGGETVYTSVEKRQLFLRSYQFSRKRSLTERIKRSLFRVKRVVCLRLKSARKFRKLVWFRLRFFFYRRRKFLRLLHSNNISNVSYPVNL
ncbi:hypothetical protein RJ641_020878 [Dillenia turbinata]|uniref:Uncharacterized protein n=1 Tax=Dillenia turbinata TaxID=194707 RepID=A0AAN8UQT5_9MAGN